MLPSLQWPKLHNFRPGSTTAARGIDLGLGLGLEELGLHDPRLGAEDIAGERRSRGYELPKTTISGAKEPGKGRRLTKGSGWPELPRKVVVDDGRAAEAVGSRGQAAAEGLGFLDRTDQSGESL
jgi:hypothetical protein